MIANSPRMTRLYPVLSKAAALSCLLTALFAPPAFADDYADVSKLLRIGQHAEALTKADAFLSKNPRDAQMRFLKGVILTEQNKSTEAIAIFTKLTEDYPSLPEPYNNLAVLYAASGQYDKARSALDAAIRTNPSYATAYENLGDVHAKLASQAYDKALQLDSGNATAKAKLTLVRSLMGNVNGGAPKPASAPATSPVVMAKAPEQTPLPSAPASAAASKPAASKPEAPKSEPKPSRAVDVEADEVQAMVHNWAKAWSSQEVKTYLGFYGNDFQPPKGMSRKAWEDERRSRISDKGRITVKVEALRVSVSGNTATAKFHQVYTSDRLTANSRKTLVLTKHGGKWQIKQENAGN